MSAAFDTCVAKGGKVRTKSKKNTYQRFCTLGDKTYAGEVKKKKKPKK